jgi:immune inhibitor A
MSVLGSRCKVTAALFALAAFALVAPLVASAMPPSPDLLQHAKTDPALQRSIDEYLTATKPAGLEEPTTSLDLAKLGTRWLSAASGSKTALSGLYAASGAGTYRQLVLLVDFSDKPAVVAPSFFDDLIFKDVVGPSSVRGYYREVSAGALDIQPIAADLPSARGWLRMPQPYAYYCPAGSEGTGSYPNNTQKLAEDALAAAEVTGVDFSNYDNDHDGYVDGVVLVHSGHGQEKGGTTADIWSHKWNVRTSKVYDGVRTDVYTTEPEYWYTARDMTTGVYCHELAHAFGLPDLYDTDGSSAGIGTWSLMSYGSWNGVNGATPARPDAFSMTKLGFVTATQLTAATTVTIRSATSSSAGDLYRIEKSGATGGRQYFLIENRQKTGTDAGLSGSGILVWHVDENVGGNSDESHFMVDLEEAHGGTQHLVAKRNYGDGADPFPGTGGKKTFSSLADPGSTYYDGSGRVAISGISANSAAMTALVTPDEQAPDTTAPITVSDAQAAYNTLALITLSASDAGWGLASTNWTLDGVAGSGTKVSTSKFGSHTLLYWSTDLAGNIEAAKTATFFVRDVTLPVVASNGRPAYTGSASVHVTASDNANGSGLASIAMKSDNAAEVTVVSASADARFDEPGQHTLAFSALDNAGNRSATSTVTFTIAAIVPIAPSPVASATEVFGGDVTVTWEPVANAVGYEYELDGATSAQALTGTTVVVTGLVEGENVVRVRALNAYGDPSAWSEPMVVVRRTVVGSLTASSTVSVARSGADAVLTVLVNDGAGVGIAGQHLALQYSEDGATWSDLTSLTTDASGIATYAYKPSTGAWVRSVLDADARHDAITSTSVKVLAAPSLGRPATSSSVRHGRAFTISGYLKPRHSSGAHNVTIKLYRYRSGKWSYYKTVRTTNSNYRGYTKYSVRTSVPTAGSWRAYACYAGTSSFAPFTTAYTRFTAK